MSLEPRLSLRALLAMIAACGVVTWLARGWLYPNRAPGVHFALIGRMDIDRDGRDDRARLTWMILRNGGTVDFDLPPPWVGEETGKLSPRIDWYVTDDRMPLREVYLAHSDSVMKMEAEMKTRVGQVIKEARLDGVRPMPLCRLLARLEGD